MNGTSWFHIFLISKLLSGKLLNFMISMNFQQLKKKRFRGFSTHFVVFRELICLFTKYKNWGKHIMILFNFSKNAVTFKTSYIYQNTNVCLERPFSEICIIQKQITDLQCKSMDWFLNETKFYWKAFSNRPNKIKKKVSG